MSDRSIHRKTDREPTAAPGGRQDPAEEYTTYRQVEPEEATEGEAEAVREAELQPGGAEPERKVRKGPETKSED